MDVGVGGCRWVWWVGVGVDGCRGGWVKVGRGGCFCFLSSLPPNSSHPATHPIRLHPN